MSLQKRGPMSSFLLEQKSRGAGSSLWPGWGFMETRSPLTEVVVWEVCLFPLHRTESRADFAGGLPSSRPSRAIASDRPGGEQGQVSV